MAQDNTNSTVEMGTSDQILVAPKKSKKLVYTIGFIAMCAVIAVVITLAVVLTRGGDAEDIITTEGPTPVTTTPTIPTTTPITTTTEPPTTNPPPPGDMDLDDVLNGEYLPTSFNGSWVSGSEIMFRNAYGELILYNVDTSKPRTLVENSSQILQNSNRVTELSADRRHVVLSYAEELIYRYSFEALYVVIDSSTGNIFNITPEGVASDMSILQNFVWGPVGTSLAFVYKNNIYYKPNLTSPAQQITSSGIENVIYNGAPDWVYEEEVFSSNNAMWFSGDGSRLAYASFNDTNVRVMRIPHFGVPGAVEFQYTRHRDIRYPKPGTDNPSVTVTIRNLAANIERTFAPPSDLNEPILAKVQFMGNQSIAIMWMNRVQSELKVDVCSEANQDCVTIFRYNEPNGWITNVPMVFNEQGDSFITILPDSVNNVRYKQILQVSNTNGTSWSVQSRTNTAHTVIDILTWTPDDVIWYTASGINDTAEQHIYSASSAGVSCFTCTVVRPDGSPCLYNEGSISGSRISINCGGPAVPQIFIYDVNGTRLSVWDDNERISNLSSVGSLPVVLRRKLSLGAGIPDADVQLQVPRDYQSRNNVPLLVNVYGGPDSSLVTKQWNVDWGSYLVNHYGIAVATIDGRGSGLKGVENMFAVHRKLGSVEIEDQISATKLLHQELPWLDSSRTCIWGWSYGGYAASLALARGDVFKCAIAVAPVVDWRFYDSIYTERYLDTPQNNIGAYRNSSLLSDQVVEAYRRKSYFLVHGTEDDNVHYQHAMLLSRLLQRRDVYFHQMSYTDENHTLAGVKPHFYHALEKFLRENML
ncbi:venom dipeptidyl peptidase 4-like [Danaus plexippus]|uniref:venom dipeptidyl peptidase 4-like n=1 Tax=Danaus plexippus TaxID=13037 RepID=UPI002AB012F7|nr:venom dipeptidyl peptidase 4-like [Danaus plexippus]XP_032511978.2 venom dipeptidyl peptidase 4-like [Danaus plexippus]